MPTARRRVVAALAWLLIGSEVAATAPARNPPARGPGQGAAAAPKAARRRPPRRKPRPDPAVGLIVPYPFPPALIIRQTPGAHDEVSALLRMLRGG